MYLFVAATILYGLAIRQDLASRTIPNFVSASLAALAFVRWTVEGDAVQFAWAAACAALGFAALILAFARGWLGGGDVKLIASTLFLVGGTGALPFLLLMSLLGGVLVPLTLVWQRLARHSTTIPYGVAISFAALWCLAADRLAPVL